ncbi:MAG: LysR family transcriptional regulator, partial [Burkholderiaceae bacterium]
MNRNTSLRHFRAFVAVANAGSFTIAAKELFLTQSALTATIQQFEEAVGFKLFDRSTRRVVMTHEAQRFKPQAEHILRQFDSAVADLESLAQGRRGHVRIAAAASVTHYFLGHAIAGMRADYPDIT